MTRHAQLFSVLLLACAPGLAQSQVAAPLAVRALDNPGATTAAPQPGAKRRSPYEIPGRLALGMGGAFIGMLGGASFGSNVMYRGGCACEDPGLEEAIVGAAIGTVIGGAIFAGIPRFTSTCNVAERIGLGVTGSLVGALAGGVLGAALGGPGVLLGYMGGAGIGAGLTSAAC